MIQELELNFLCQLFIGQKLNKINLINTNFQNTEKNVSIIFQNVFQKNCSRRKRKDEA